MLCFMPVAAALSLTQSKRGALQRPYGSPITKAGRYRYLVKLEQNSYGYPYLLLLSL